MGDDSFVKFTRFGCDECCRGVGGWGVLEDIEKMRVSVVGEGVIPEVGG